MLNYLHIRCCFWILNMGWQSQRRHPSQYLQKQLRLKIRVIRTLPHDRSAAHANRVLRWQRQALTLYCELRYESVSKHPHKNSMLSSTLDAAEYYPITVGLFLLVVLWAVVVKDLGSVFTLLGWTSVWIVFYNTVIFLHVN